MNQGEWTRIPESRILASRTFPPIPTHHRRHSRFIKGIVVTTVASYSPECMLRNCKLTSSRPCYHGQNNTIGVFLYVVVFVRCCVNERLVLRLAIRTHSLAPYCSQCRVQGSVQFSCVGSIKTTFCVCWLTGGVLDSLLSSNTTMMSQLSQISFTSADANMLDEGKNLIDPFFNWYHFLIDTIF